MSEELKELVSSEGVRPVSIMLSLNRTMQFAQIRRSLESEPSLGFSFTHLSQKIKPQYLQWWRRMSAEKPFSHFRQVFDESFGSQNSFGKENSCSLIGLVVDLLINCSRYAREVQSGYLERFF